MTKRTRSSSSFVRALMVGRGEGKERVERWGRIGEYGGGWECMGEDWRVWGSMGVYGGGLVGMGEDGRVGEGGEGTEKYGGE